MNPGDLVKIWYEHDGDKSYNLPPVQGILVETTDGYQIFEEETRKLHCVYVEGRLRSYWEPNWKFEAIEEEK